MHRLNSLVIPRLDGLIIHRLNGLVIPRLALSGYDHLTKCAVVGCLTLFPLAALTLLYRYFVCAAMMMCPICSDDDVPAGVSDRFLCW